MRARARSFAVFSYAEDIKRSRAPAMHYVTRALVHKHRRLSMNGEACARSPTSPRTHVHSHVRVYVHTYTHVSTHVSTKMYVCTYVGYPAADLDLPQIVRLLIRRVHVHACSRTYARTRTHVRC